MATAPRVFISYSHDSESHRERVLALSERLRRDGIETMLDSYVEGGTPEEGWPRWMLNRLDEADRVLLVCTEIYCRRFRGREVPGQGRGVDWEGAIIAQSLYDARSLTSSYVPILFDPADAPYIPEPVRGQSFYCVTTEAAYRDLYDALLGQAVYEPGPVGEPQPHPRPRVEPLSFAVAPAVEPSRGRNPFLAESSELIGRDQALGRILEKLGAGSHWSVVGGAGSGKTSLLRVFHGRIGPELGWGEESVAWVNFRTTPRAQGPAGDSGRPTRRPEARRLAPAGEGQAPQAPGGGKPRGDGPGQARTPDAPVTARPHRRALRRAAPHR